MSRPLRIAWLCFYPASDFRSRPSLRTCRAAFHPVPWITVQAPLLAAMPDIELHIVTVGRDYTADDHFVHDDIHFHFLRLPGVPRAALWYQVDRYRIHECLRTIEPDLVHGFGTEGSYAYAAVTSGHRAVVRIQGIMARIVPAIGWRGFVKNPEWIVPLTLERWTVKRCPRFICPSAFAADFVRTLNPSAIIHVVKTPVRPELFDIERVPAPAAPPHLLFLGSVLKAKGIEVLLRAFATVLREFPAAVLDVAGAYDQAYYDGVLRPLVTDLGIAGDVVFHGFVAGEAVGQFLARASLLALPTFMDTSPNVVLEAQVVGTPVVATTVGGCVEMIDNSRTGWLVPPDSVDAMADALLRVLRDPDAAEEMAEAARRAAIPDHQPQVQVQKLAEVYRSMAGSGAVGHSDSHPSSYHKEDALAERR